MLFRSSQDNTNSIRVIPFLVSVLSWLERKNPQFANKTSKDRSDCNQYSRKVDDGVSTKTRTQSEANGRQKARIKKKVGFIREAIIG